MAKFHVRPSSMSKPYANISYNSLTTVGDTVLTDTCSSEVGIWIIRGDQIRIASETSLEGNLEIEVQTL